MAGNRVYDQTKFENLVLYLAERSREDVGYGKIKLNKLLFRCDFEAFRLLGASITGEEYKHQDLGPVAAHLPSLLKRLANQNELVVEAVAAGPYTRQVPVPTGSRQADPSVFTEEELAIIDATLEELREHGGASVSRWSHEASVGWRVHSAPNALIPYSSALLSIRKLSDAAQAALQRRFSPAQP